MKNWQEILNDISIFYITPDVKRGIGIEGVIPNYHIVCTYFDPLVPILKNQGANIFCLSEGTKETDEELNNSGRLLEHPRVLEYIRKNTKGTPFILVFKPSIKVDLLCKKMGYISLVNNQEFNDVFEDKVNFFETVKRNFPQYLVSGETGKLGEMGFDNLAKRYDLPLVIQFSHGWAGKTTFFIQNKNEFIKLMGKFAPTKVKVNKFIDGFTVLNNACIYRGEVLMSQPAMQISNIKELKEKPSVTCGRQWPVMFLDKHQQDVINKITKKIGSFMGKCGFKGYFGLDFLIARNGKVYLSENNARFTASSSFYTKLELGSNTVPLFVYHLAAFLGKEIRIGLDGKIDITGAQIIFRNPEKQPRISQEINFGIFNCNNFDSPSKKVSYLPERLKKDELIFIRRVKRKSKSDDLELSRIECREKVLRSINKLSDWVELLINRSYVST